MQVWADAELRLNQIDWDAVRFFLAAARAGSLLGAARALSVKHTTVARRLDALESAIGAKLFHRTTGGLRLTDAGERVRPVAEEMERASRRLAESASVEGEIAGIVRVSISEGFAGLIVGKLGGLHEAYPRLVVDVVLDNASVDLAGGEADVAIRMGPIRAPTTLICSKLGTFGWALYGVAKRAKTKRSEWPVIGYDSNLAHSPGARWIETNIAAHRVVLRCNSLLAALNAATAGVGVAALPCVLGAFEPALARVSDEVIGTRDAFLVVHPDQQDSARVRVVLDLLRNVVAQNRAIIAG